MKTDSTQAAIIVLSQGTLDLARRLRHAIGGEIWAPYSWSEKADRGYDSLVLALRDLFGEGRPIIGICAAGILIRALAPCLSDKRAEPPVIAIARDASAVVPLLGGHHGANDLARALASALGIEAAITTAGDRAWEVALDAPPDPWRLRDSTPAKGAMAALLSGERARLTIEEGPPPDWLGQVPQSPDGKVVINFSTRADAKGDLVYAPVLVALGVGCERGTDAAEIARLAEAALTEANVAPEAIACVVSIDLKAAEPAVHALAQALGVPARFFTPSRLEEEAGRLANPSQIVFRETGCHGVAEGAALAAVGAQGSLILPKRLSEHATVALGRSALPINPEQVGRARGHLSILGIGPGAPESRTPEVDRAIRKASDLVGYKLYLDLLGPMVEGKLCHGLELGEEEARARLALDLAAEGRDVALISSGDAGIYAMASLVFELIDREGRPDWARIEIIGLPGISAMQVAASRAGAPLGHDFCAISLSDLLTPWEAIEARLRAAAEGDFVVALYNPVSARRTTQLARAKEILLRHSPADTPVVLARNLGRAGEVTRLVRLDELNVADVDMLTIVIVGATSTRAIARPDGGSWVYTPRGYERKAANKAGAAE